MLKLHGYTLSYLGHKRGALIASPTGQVFHVTGNLVNEVDDFDTCLKDWQDTDTTWQQRPVPETLRDTYTQLGLRCPAKLGEAIEFLALLVARKAIWGYERFTLETVSQARLDMMTGEEKEVLLKGVAKLR